MQYRNEAAAVKMAAKRSRKAGSVEAGYSSLYAWYGLHPNRDIIQVLKCFRKWAKRF